MHSCHVCVCVSDPLPCAPACGTSVGHMRKGMRLVGRRVATCLVYRKFFTASHARSSCVRGSCQAPCTHECVHMIRVPTKIVPCMCALTHAMFSQCQIDNGCECHAAQAFFRNNVFFVEMTQTCVLSTQELPADILSLVRFTFLQRG